MRPVVVAVLLACLLCLPKMTAWGAPSVAPSNQTVPPPTLTSPVSEVPTATPVPNNEDDNDHGNNPVEPTATPTPRPAALTATINVPRLNVREGPGTGYPVVGVVASGGSVQVLARTELNDWWRVCCISGTTTAGWAAAQYLVPNFDAAQSSVLIPVLAGLPTPPPPTAIPTVDPAVPPTPIPTPVLQLQISQDPLYTWKGQTVGLVYTIVNNSPAAVTNLELRSELAPQLRFVAIAAVDGGETTTENLETGPVIFTVKWPTLGVGERLAVRVNVQVVPDLPDGSVVDNLAVVTAQESAPLTAGISIGMPPADLPTFQ